MEFSWVFGIAHTRMRQRPSAGNQRLEEKDYHGMVSDASGNRNGRRGNRGIVGCRRRDGRRTAAHFSGLAGVAATRQVVSGGFSTTPTASSNTQLTLKIRQCGCTIGNRLCYLAFGDGITYANKHENNYHPSQKKKQLAVKHPARMIL
jgi:hypothetical protein